MDVEQPIDDEAVRQRIPWAGRVDTGEHDFSARYREIMAIDANRRVGQSMSGTSGSKSVSPSSARRSLMSSAQP
jgi:hypothetical protein